MGVFTRVRDIFGANINVMLDRAEDPEKLVRAMIREMEDTLVELKASCAAAMTAKKNAEVEYDRAQRKTIDWESRAKRAVNQGRENLAREALLAKRKYTRRAEALEADIARYEETTIRYRDDLRRLEDKLKSAKEKRRVLVQRHIHAGHARRAEQEMRRYDVSEALGRFAAFEERVERSEAEAALANTGPRSDSLEDAFERLERDEEIERELEALKKVT